INKKATKDSERSPIPVINNTNPIVRAHGFVTFLPKRGANGVMIAKAINGKLVRNATLQIEKPTSSRIVPINWPTEVIAGRTLNAIISILSTYNIRYNLDVECYLFDFKSSTKSLYIYYYIIKLFFCSKFSTFFNLILFIVQGFFFLAIMMDVS